MSCNVVAALLIAEIKKGNIMTELEYEISKILEQEQPITQSEPQDLAHIICELPKIKAIQQEPRVIKKKCFHSFTNDLSKFLLCVFLINSSLRTTLNLSANTVKHISTSPNSNSILSKLPLAIASASSPTSSNNFL